MNSEWQNFLEQNGATIADGEVKGYGDPDNELQAAIDSDTLCDLSHDGLIMARGEESSGFLQGQFTNDVRAVTESHHQLSSYCSPKGRMMVLFRLFQRDDAYYLQLPATLLEATLKRLKMFVLMSKVELEDVSDRLVRFALAGPSAEQLLARQLGEAPAEADESLSRDGVTVLRVAGAHPRFILHGETEPMMALWQALAGDGARPVGAEGWRLQDIRAGMPNVLPETVEAFVPQMVNLQQINGVNFKKGCYTGQEVVARMQYLGKLKRRMYLGHVDCETRPAAGDVLRSPDSASGQGAGKVVNVASAPQGGYDILAVIEIASADAGQIYLDEQLETKLTLMPLPYSMEPSEQSPQAAG
jgi:folate-binding protein YgfZ